MKLYMGWEFFPYHDFYQTLKKISNALILLYDLRPEAAKLMTRTVNILASAATSSVPAAVACLNGGS
ncbi:MAG: hypothetical protein O7G88_19000, partial [bacterium]|nr:hypothetical protein [bacterium]